MVLRILRRDGYNDVRQVYKLIFTVQNRCTMKPRLFVYALLTLVLLSSCTLGGSAEPTATPVDIAAIQTAAVQTVVAPITQTAEAFVPSPTATVTVAATLTPGITATPTQNGVPTEKICNQMAFVSDSTVPDNTVVTAGQTFLKTWKVKNTGPCAWTTAYTLIYAYGDNKLSGQTTALTAKVDPNTDIEISITLKAPVTPGTYHSYWRLVDNNGYPFGTVLTVVIVVP
jgi:hypothetical protein